MILSHEEKHSALWMKLKAYYESRISDFRVRNDSFNRSEIDTAKLRGQIFEIKEFLALGEDLDPEQEVGDES